MLKIVGPYQVPADEVGQAILVAVESCSHLRQTNIQIHNTNLFGC